MPRSVLFLPCKTKPSTWAPFTEVLNCFLPSKETDRDAFGLSKYSDVVQPTVRWR
jgi:hypothetical protein